MKKIRLIMVTILFATCAFGQGLQNFFEEPNNSMNGGIGVTWIDGNAFTTFTLAPEFAFGKFGIGLNIQLLFDNSNGFEFRDIGWNDGAGAWRMISYARWGLKYDPLYIRVGSLQGAILGNGFVMGYYTNKADYDNRKIGLIFDVDFGLFGMESMTSSLGNLEIIGGRLYVRPLLNTGLPVLKNLEFGGTYVTDVDPDNNSETDNSVTEIGADITLPIVKTEVFNTAIYADYAKILDHGDGTAVGVRAGVPNFIGIFGIWAKLEKRFMNDQFLPNYFNALYELERNRLDARHYYPDAPAFTGTKLDFLKTVTGNSGIFGELAGHILGQVRLLGNYQYTDGVKNSGILHLEALSKEFIPSVRLRFTYDKVGIETFEDARTLDYRSVAVGEIGYRTYQFFYVSLRYRWNFFYDAQSGEYRPQERFEPSISFAMDF